MPGVVVVAARWLLATFISDMLRVFAPMLVGLVILILVAGQSLGVSSMSSPHARGEFYRPLVTTVALRTALEVQRDATGRPVLDQDGDLILLPVPAEQLTDPAGMIPPAFLMALADVLTGFNPLHACASPADATRPRADPTARRGLLAADPLRFRSIPHPDTARAKWRLALAFARRDQADGAPAPPPPTPEAQPPERVLCDAEVNAYAAAVLIGGYRWGAENEVEGVNGAYRLLVEAYWRAVERYQADRRDWERCRDGQREDEAAGAPPRACGDRPTEPEPPLPPAPSCVQPELRTVDTPTVPSEWDEEEMICQVMRRWWRRPGQPPRRDYLGVWYAFQAWKSALARPITVPGQAIPPDGDPLDAPVGSAPYNVTEAIRYARGQLGKPYVYGAPVEPTNPNPPAFDCSGLVQWAYHQAGFHLPRVAADQFAATTGRGARVLPRAALQPGDLVFFGTTTARADGITHVGIYLGGGQMIDAPDWNQPVRVTPLYASFLGGGRVVSAAAPAPARVSVWAWTGGRRFPVTQEFGAWDCTNYASCRHPGLDLGLPTGTPVTAALPGRVTLAGSYGGYGQAVVVETSIGAVVLGHLSRVLVTPGQLVQPGQPLGLSGATGVSTGPHLHLETRNASSQPFSPLLVFDR
ncbi:MAG: peptidoglycan DD-metalloendopeptidase family protein [Chloroflexi bacterium]|nr:peptidoglycan DD-metalloendopeptidase family protein [Chloroflexota bacterium]